MTMLASDIRTKFLNYFAKNGHTIVESAPLVPANDPSVMFTVAGMVQFKDVFLGKEKRPYTRAVTTQKCLRAGGKHNDLENVGFTARHHTFFEMLGNFSFGDYFKKDAIRFAWEFATKELKFPIDKLYVTVFEDDDEAAEIWHTQEKVAKDRIYRMGEKDNFWSMGDTGPCGPCSELFVDRGEQYGCGKATCKMGCDCDRYMEFWNLVFMQFNRDETGKLTPLPKPSVDTGAGLERIASIVQDVQTNYDTDIFKSIMQQTGKLAGMTYNPDVATAASFRVIADHARAATFLIGDGVMPSNEGRGYVLRRIIRRAIRHGKKLGFERPFLHTVCGFVIDQMNPVFTDLESKRAFIDRAVLSEEEQFLRTLEKGLGLLDDEAAKLKKGGSLPGDVAFKLYDTFGFPFDLTRTICEEKNLTVDEAGFEKFMEQQRSNSRQNWKGTGEAATQEIYLQVAEQLKGKMPKFVGYDGLSAEGECLAIISNHMQSVKDAKADEQVAAVFSVTPFYAEGGGQVGDQGRVSGQGLEANVVDCKKFAGDLVVVFLEVKSGSLQVGKKYQQTVDGDRRMATDRNHTATHMLHWALRTKLGEHVKQAGSLVNEEFLRFDFAHFEPVPRSMLKEIEDMINQRIWGDFGVDKQEMGKEEAVKAGAMAFFGEKYGDRVRVVKVAESVELCGGTHVDHAGDIHLFKIISEAGIAAGVRRIVATTAAGAYKFLSEQEDEVRQVHERLKSTNAKETLEKIEKLFGVEKELRRDIEKLSAAQAGGEIQSLLQKAESIGGLKLLVHEVPADAQGVKKLRDLAEACQQKADDAVLVLGMAQPNEGKVFVLAATGKKAQAKVSAADIIKELAPMIEGRGGGKADMAQAGGTKVAALAATLGAAKELLARLAK